MFDPARLLQARVDNRARVCVRQNYYSVPARYAARRVNVRLSAMKVEVLDGPRVVARHERAAGKYAEVLTLDHYLEVLKYKPGAMPGATALAVVPTSVVDEDRHRGQAVERGVWPPVIVEAQPSSECPAALGVGPVQPRIGPLIQEGLLDPLDLAVELLWSSGQVSDGVVGRW
jgi:hypothetical protein